MTKLKISSDLELPAEAVTQTFAILAKRGSGKTYTGAVMAEELLKAGLQTVIVDPVGVWWGLRAAANGKDEGLAILVMGGEHGDLPLQEEAGEIVADVVVEERRSVVLDLSLLRKNAQKRFMVAFLETLYRKNRAPLQLIVDEADAFAPQRPMKDEARLLGAMEDIVRRGRARGIGCTLITQRPAVLSKNVLTQIEVLVCLRMIAPQDRQAVEGWVEVHGTKEQCAQLLESLPSLPIGTAWFWSPGWLDLFQRVKVRRRETFDSSSTPVAGDKVSAPKKLKPVDLEALKERMAATIEEAQANDPRELKTRIAALERELQAAKAKTPAPEIRQVPVISEEQLEQLSCQSIDLVETAKGLRETANALLSAHSEICGLVKMALVTPSSSPPPPIHSENAATRKEVHKLHTPARAVAAREPKNGGSIPPAKQKLLDGLATFHNLGLASVKKAQLGIYCGVSPKSSSFHNHLGAMKSAGLIDYPSGGQVALTHAGNQVADYSTRFTSHADLHAAWMRKLPPSQADLMRTLISVYPASIKKGELAEAVSKSAASSSFHNQLGELRTLGLLDYPQPGMVAATELLFPPI